MIGLIDNKHHYETNELQVSTEVLAKNWIDIDISSESIQLITPCYSLEKAFSSFSKPAYFSEKCSVHNAAISSL